MLRILLPAIPLVLAVFGPLLPLNAAPEADPLLGPENGHPLGTDALGRDVLALVFSGGTSVAGMTLAALLLAYLLGVPLGLFAASRRRRGTDEAVLRVLDILLAFPGLLVLMVLAAAGHREPATLIVAAAVLQLPAVTRIVRAAALAPGCRTAVEAMYLQGMPWWRIQFGYVARSALGPVATDAGTRLGIVLYLLASANFLGLGLPGSAPDWAVVIERNATALFSQPLAVLVPAALLAMLCVGANLTVDRYLARLR
ncbi:ABC transporter permease [Sciscionella marina]|uniref:ABC transporter permease n=1 Tax=Sciscionella marina TaxID=508770 RepID=UPI00035FE623|nr:ABC transporter permease subunit [Sciscionella marina]